MRILLCSHAFAPNIGGIETVSAILADQWIRLGSSVTVVTQTPGGQFSREYEVVRRPSVGQLRALAKESDIIFQNNISLRTLIPLLPWRKPVVIAHQTLLGSDVGRRWREHLKCEILSRCRNIAVSSAVAKALPVKSTLIFNPFEPGEFTPSAPEERGRDIVFLGRLVSDKGCDVVLRALVILKTKGLYPSFTVIGDGPEMVALKRMAADLALSEQVTFRGALGKGRGREVTQHKIMVVPSIWIEPFGVVALEGLAAGCAVVASNSGGLPEAVGQCGLLFPNGDAKALAAALMKLLDDPSLRNNLLLEKDRHLRQFEPETVARQYLDIFASVMSG